MHVSYCVNFMVNIVVSQVGRAPPKQFINMCSIST